MKMLLLLFLGCLALAADLPDGASARLGNPVQCDHFKFVWDGRKFTIVYSFGDDRELEPEQLRDEEQLLAA